MKEKLNCSRHEKTKDTNVSEGRLYNAYYLFDCISIHTAIPEGMLQSDQRLLLEKVREIDKLKSDLQEKEGNNILPTTVYIIST